jgi:hypothetical protein
MTAPSERYPLWCVDRGHEYGEVQYRGPYDAEAEAVTARDDDGAGVVRRCRRVLASELDGIGWAYDRLAEELDDQARGGEVASVLPEAWGDWEDEVVTARDGAREAFREFVDRWFTVDAYVCEGDEP